MLIDTAGIRRRGKVASGAAAERYSTMRALTALSRADVAVLVIDAVEGLTAQDAHVAGYVVEEGKGLVVAVNKWDLVEDKTDKTFDQYVEWIRNDAPFLDFAPVVSISAKTGQRVGRVLELAVDIWAERRKRVPTGELNRMLMAATDRTPPPLVRGKRPKLFYATQAAIAPPTFVFFASDASSVHFSYRRYLENRLRDTFGFHGTPIRLVFRDRASVKLPRRRKTRSAPPKPTRRTHIAAVPPGPLMAASPTVAVVGAGAWGTTLASIVARREPVLLLTHRAEVADEINATHRNERRLPGHRPARGRGRDRRPGRGGRRDRPRDPRGARRRTCGRSRAASRRPSPRPRTCCRSSRAWRTARCSG